MKNTITLAAFCLIGLLGQAQIPFYKGKSVLESRTFDSLKRDIVRDITTRIKGISRDDLLFFKIDLDNKGVASVKELYKTENDISAKVRAALNATATCWSNKTGKKITLVIPVFLIIDKEEGKLPKEFYSTLTSRTIDDTGALNCVLIPPVIVNFFQYQ